MPVETRGLFVKRGLVIPEAELSERFIQSAGPGGQNVNKVASAVQLSFDVRRSPSLSAPARAALLDLKDARLNKDGVLTITARRFREQARNRADARVRLAELIVRAITPSRPRVATSVPKSSKRQRLQAKKRQGEAKRNRGRLSED